MSDEDPTKELPGVPNTEPTIVTVMERLNAMQEGADRHHREILERFAGTDLQIGALRTEVRTQGHMIETLNNHILRSQADQRDLDLRITELEAAS